MIDEVVENPADVAKGVVTAPFTAAPDLLGMGIQGMNYVANKGRRAFGLPEGDTFPGAGISGDPIRELVGLDPKSTAGMVGEFMDPSSVALKGVGLLADAVRHAPDIKAAMAGTTGLLLGRGDDVADAARTLPDELPAPKFNQQKINVAPIKEVRKNYLRERTTADQVSGGGIDLLVNPDEKAMARFAGRESPNVRFMIDNNNGDLYVWDASTAIHDQVLDAIPSISRDHMNIFSDYPVAADELFDEFRVWEEYFPERFEGPSGEIRPAVWEQARHTDRGAIPGVKAGERTWGDTSHEAIMAREDATPRLNQTPERAGLLNELPAPLGANQSSLSTLNRSDFIYNNDIPPPAEPNSRRLIDAGQDLQREALDAWGGKPMEMTPENLPVLADNMTKEAMASFEQRPEMAGWYKSNLEEAMGYASKIHPELATDQQAQDAFKVIMAITSNGQEVGLNARLTNDYYRMYRETGKFPVMGSGKEAGAMKQSFEAANTMIDDVGFDGFKDFLSQEFTVKELKDAGFKIGGELMGTTVPGSAIFGPKIGGGFMQNLMGNFDPPTMDRWFTRTWGRHTGSLTAEPAKLDKQRQSLREVIGRKRRVISDMGFDPAEVMSDPAKFDEFANALHSQFARGGYKDKTPINNAARNLSKSLTNLNDSPTNGTQRNYMRGVMQQVRDNMRAQGIEVDTADVQALLWYAEKDLYGKMGARVNTETVDYATVWKQLAGQ